MKKISLVVVLLITVLIPSFSHPAPNVEETLKAIVQIRSRIPKEARTARSLGTERDGNGILIDSNGHVLTIGYLILEAEFIEVILPNGRSVKAAFVGYDHDTGFGLLRTDEPLPMKPIALGESSNLKQGAAILVAGHGGAGAVQGVRVISRKEFAGYWEYLLDNAIFTSPPHKNFAGSAIIGANGRLLGIGSLFSQVVMPGLGIVPGNMFVPIDLLKPILASLKKSGRSPKPPRPWLGLHAEEVRGRVIINRVSRGGPAEKAGIHADDIILAVNEKPIVGLSDFYRKVWALGNAGVDIPVRVLQGTKIRSVTIHSADRYQFLQLRPKRKATGTGA